jgi:hypothetical protein
MALLGGLLNLDTTLTNLLGGTSTGGSSSGGGTSSSGGLLAPVTNLIDNLVKVGGTGSAGSSNGVLNLGLLNDKGVVSLNLLDQDLVVLPNNGGIISSDLLGDGSNGNPTQLLDLGNLLGDGGLLDLTGILDGGVLDLTGILGDVLKLLSPTGLGDPDDFLDPDGEFDPDAFDHVMMGTEGADSFLIPTESTYVEGRGHYDHADFARSAEGFSIAVGEDAVLLAEGDELFYLKNVERVHFLEATLVLDTGAGENGGMAYRLYQATFDRTPDNDGLKFWVDYLDDGKSIRDAAAGFISSMEFQREYGTNPSNTAFAAALYENVLGRAADAGGLTYWVNQLNSGAMSKADVLVGFSESAENVSLVGASIENGFTLS